MPANPPSLRQKLNARSEQGALRELRLSSLPVDFCSNDYLGIARGSLLRHEPALAGGSTGSRLLSGNHPLLEELESELAAFHKSEAALLFNSGYDANLGLLSSVPQKRDTVLYDALSHASIRDGIRLSFAQSFSFRHNDLEDLARKIGTATGSVYVVTESVFSMDGDLCPLEALVDLCARSGAYLIVDEAHATGVIGDRGEGLVQDRACQDGCFARVHTFGKAVGCHGAAVIGSADLKQYLLNFSRSLVYTTAMSPHAAGLIRQSYRLFPEMREERAHLQRLVDMFPGTGSTPIQAVLVPGNENARAAARMVQGRGMDVRPILYPTVPKGTERLRVVLHAFNTTGDVGALLDAVKQFLVFP